MEKTEVIDEVLALIAEAAKVGNIARVEKLILAAKALGAGKSVTGPLAASQERAQNDATAEPKLQGEARLESVRISFRSNPRSAGKRQGREARQEWLAERARQGAPLMRVRGRLYQDAEGHRVGISFANERPEGDKWWMGLPDEEYDVIVLLCRTSDGNIFDFLLPRQFLAPYWSFFSRGGPDQVEFHVERRGSSFVVGVPGRSQQSISGFLSNFECL